MKEEINNTQRENSSVNSLDEDTFEKSEQTKTTPTLFKNKLEKKE